MMKSLTPMTLAALMALPLPLLAQDSSGAVATEESQPAADANASQPPKADDVLDLGQPVDQGPQLGQRYSKEQHGDWDLACVKTEGDTDPCSLLQIMTDEAGSPMAEFSLFRIDQEGSQAVAGATVIVPLETLLPAALTIAIDGAPAKRYNYSFCNPMGCVAQIGLTQGDIDAMKKGNVAKLSLRPAPAPDQVITMDLSLSGFTAGFNVVDVVQQ
ncbi:invasion associated locus B family protein [Phaeobacter sp.]|uniref:invasion associated locus B family protein n=1 Tax=Phaeobacter sp. TaxID=1902409 RepID=UPI0025EF368B|nr:invasion associated locus B family protein [Phaeobacter sp.]